MLSPEAKTVWESISEDTKKVIQKGNPFRNERNAAIREIQAKGVKQTILVEITGLSKNGILCIIHQGDRDIPKKDKNIYRELKALKRAIAALQKAVKLEGGE
jgi:hypothetical protein